MNGKIEHYTLSIHNLFCIIIQVIIAINFPASGNANNGSLNNVGSNGNYWSSSLNTSNVNNGRQLNFNNNGNVNNNNNNRYYGYPVRGVLGQILLIHLCGNGFHLLLFCFYYKMYHLTKDQLLFDLYIAFEDACKHKNKKHYVKEFKEDLHNNLIELRDELWYRTYKPSVYICFIVNHPKKREIFAAKFRDRIVHHLYFNYTHKLFENTFIYDSYACIKGKGTHFGIKRLEHHIRQESNNYKDKCYILKMDIKGYFIHINRMILKDVALSTLNKMRKHRICKNSDKVWEDTIDYEFITFLTNEIVLLNPSKECIIKSDLKEWNGLPKSKSLIYTEKGCGLPIGNLTSQLLSNVFLNLLDQYIKRVLKCKHYGRYVDDFYIVSKDKEFLHQIIPLIEEFLKTVLHLTLSKGKTIITNSNYGVEFLGAFIKPHRVYISNACLRRINHRTNNFNERDKDPICCVNSFLGIFSHYKSFNLRKAFAAKLCVLSKYGHYNESYTKFISFPK